MSIISLPASAESVAESPWLDDAWVSPTNIFSEDDTYASITSNTYDNGDQSYVLKAYNFDFSAIPDGRTIYGVICRVNCYYATGTNSMDLAQLLDTSRAKVGTNLAATPIPLSTVSTNIIELGAADNLWGNALTTTWLKNSNFGVALGFLATGNNSDIFVDYVELEVFYEPGTDNLTANNIVAGAPTLDHPTLTELVTVNLTAIDISTGAPTLDHPTLTPVVSELIDDFNRDNQVLTAGPYTLVTGTDYGVVDNQTAAFTDAGYGLYLHNTRTYGPDCWAYIKCENSLATSDGVGLCVRGSYTLANGYYAEWYENVVAIYTLAGGSYVERNTEVVGYKIPNCKLKLEVIGNVVTAYIDTGSGWEFAVSWTDTSNFFPDAGYLGFQFYQAAANNMYLDDFSGGEQSSSTHNLTANNIVTGAPTLDHPTIGQTHVLDANDISSGSPTLEHPTIGQVHVLTANNISTGSPTLDHPTIVVVTPLVANDISAGTPTLEHPTIGQTHNLVASNISAGAPTLGPPTIGQIHVLSANDISSGAPVLGHPSMAGQSFLEANDISTGAPTLDHPTIGQVHVLTSNNITTGEPTLDHPSLVEFSSLVANDISTGAPTLGHPSLQIVTPLEANDISTGSPTLDHPTIGQTHVLDANDISSGAPVLGHPAVGSFGEDTLIANDISTGSPTLEHPTLGQIHVLEANDISSGTPTLEHPDISVISNLVANDIHAGAPILGHPTIGQTHVLDANDISSGAPVLGHPMLRIGEPPNSVTLSLSQKWGLILNESKSVTLSLTESQSWSLTLDNSGKE